MACGEPKYCTNCIEGVKKLFNIKDTYGTPSLDMAKFLGDWNVKISKISDKSKIKNVDEEDLKKGIDRAIEILTIWRNKIAKENFKDFDGYISEHRDLERSDSNFIQTSPYVLEIRLEDRRSEGEIIG